MAENVLRVGGLTVNCPLSWADQSTILVRPEDIQIGATQDGAGRAVVQSRSFLGDRVQLTLSAWMIKRHCKLKCSGTTPPRWVIPWAYVFPQID